MKNRLPDTEPTTTDLFCGCGGSSEGAQNAGVKVELALNHWKLAVETHSTNFQNTRHDCTDVQACDPRYYPDTHILIASPECTNHSLAKGKKAVKQQLDLYATGKIDPAAERSRATMWDVCRFAEVHGYLRIIVENVVDARSWCMWDAWLMAMQSLGYQHQCCYLNSMHFAPCPQSRDRMYVVFWKNGTPKPNLHYTPAAHCPKCNADVASVQVWKNPAKKFGKYRRNYVYCCPLHGTVVEPYYYASFNIIDWSNPGQRIGDRKRPPTANTVKRMQHGIDTYSDSSFIMHAAYSDKARGVTRPLNQPLFTQTTFESQAIVRPFIINDQHTTGTECRVRSTGDAMQTINTTPHFKIITPPFLLKMEHTTSAGYTTSAASAMATQTTCESGAIVTPPFMVELKGTSTSRPLHKPMACATTVNYHGIVTTESYNAFLQVYNNGTQTSHVTDAIDTITTRDRHALVSYTKPTVEDCYFRMLFKHEIQKGMAFRDSYIVLGTNKKVVRQLGNAVNPPVMEWIVNQCKAGL